MESYNFAGIAMNTATVGEHHDLFTIVDTAVKFGYGGISVSRADLQKVGLRAANTCIANSGLTVTTLSRIGPLTAANQSMRKSAIEDAKVAIEEAATINAQCLVVIAGGTPSRSQTLHDCRAQVIESLIELITTAEKSGVRLSLEPLHPFFAASRGCFNTIGDVIQVMNAFEGRIGLTVDTFHTWWDPRAACDLATLKPGQILAFQVADWLSATTDPFRDRGMPGEGVICFDELLEAVTVSGYRGFIDVEVISERWRELPIDVIFSNAIDAVATLIPSLLLHNTDT